MRPEESLDQDDRHGDGQDDGQHATEERNKYSPQRGRSEDETGKGGIGRPRRGYEEAEGERGGHPGELGEGIQARKGTESRNRYQLRNGYMLSNG